MTGEGGNIYGYISGYNAVNTDTDRAAVMLYIRGLKTGDVVNIDCEFNAGALYSDNTIGVYNNDDIFKEIIVFTTSAVSRGIKTYTMTTDGFILVHINHGNTSNLTRYFKVYNIEINGIQIYP